MIIVMLLLRVANNYILDDSLIILGSGENHFCVVLYYQLVHRKSFRKFLLFLFLNLTILFTHVHVYIHKYTHSKNHESRVYITNLATCNVWLDYKCLTYFTEELSRPRERSFFSDWSNWNKILLFIIYRYSISFLCIRTGKDIIMVRVYLY